MSKLISKKEIFCQEGCKQAILTKTYGFDRVYFSNKPGGDN